MSDDDEGGSNRQWVFASLGAVALGVLAYFAIGWLTPAPEPRQPGPVGRLVEVAPVREAGHLVVTQTGFVRPVEQLTLSSEVSGRVARIADEFRVGQKVEAGAALIELDPARFEANVAAAEARLAAARARRDTARSSVQRQRQLGENGFAADARLEEVETALASSEAELALARSELDLARIAREDATLVAPYDAIVRVRDVSLGQILGPGTNVGALIRADQVEVPIGLLPRQRALLDPDASLIGRAVDLFPLNGPRQRLASGQIAAIDPSLDPVARTLGLRVRIDDPFAGDRVRVGELVEVVIPVIGDGRRVLEVPAVALKGADRLWRIRGDDTLEAVEPTIVRRGDGQVQVLADALAVGDRVLMTDLASAVDGTRVRVATDEGTDGQNLSSTDGESRSAAE